MSFLGSLGTLPVLDFAIQKGRGAVASALGQTYTVYRLTNQSGSVISGQPLFPAFPARLRKATKVAIENTSFDLECFTATCDNEAIQKQDVLVENGYESDNGIWVFAQERPTRETIWVRAETLCFISRPYTASGSVAEQPASGVTVQTSWGGTSKPIEKYLILTNGLYSYSATATTGASVPVGIQPLNRVRDGRIPKVPTTQYRTHHLAYVPLLPGEQLNEQDRINAANGDRYEIMEVHTTDMVGLSGNVCIVEKLAT